MRARAFVAMPFGTREVPSLDGGGASFPVNFDELYEFVIAPALRDAGCEPFRADEEAGAGDIRTDMFFELVTADLVVADISILNPNVFYELGVRHGVAERGVFMIAAGWSRRPFDVAPDRTFGYDGLLCVPSTERDEGREERLAAEVKRLGTVFRQAIAVDGQTVGSPVYQTLRGLRPADWSAIETARAKYFEGILDDWQARVRIARRYGRAGDVLTLARDAPTRFHRGKLLLEAARALVELQRFDVAESVLHDLLASDPGNLDAACVLGLVLGRLGRAAEAEQRISAVLEVRPDHPEAQGALGRIHKDAWRAMWTGVDDLDERVLIARRSAAQARLAIRSYRRAHLRDLESYYNGINVVGLMQLLRHVGASTEAGSSVADSLEDLVAVVRVAATVARQQAYDAGAEEQVVWPASTLGELDLLVGETEQAVELYVEAVSAPGATLFQLESMLSQLGLYAELGLRVDAVAEVRAALEPMRKRVAQPAARHDNVVVCSGHMTDAPDRPEERFPQELEDAVRARVRRELEAAAAGPGTLAICGGARGADIIFGELAVEMGADLLMLLALPQPELLAQSVRLPGDEGGWEERFRQLVEHAEVAIQSERLGDPPAGMDVFSRTNLWILDTARVEAGDRGFSTILVWDEKPSGDGPGGTSDFAERAERMSSRFAIVNPTKLEV
jgi:tetratricopeptide (TPR) repeat protein